MKKLIRAVLAGILAVSLAGCSGKKAADEITETVDGFFTTLESGEYKDAYEYLSGNAKDSFTSVIDQYGSVEKLFENITLDETVTEKINKLMKLIMGSVFRNHQITNTEKGENNTYTINVTVDVMDSSAVSDLFTNVDVNTMIPDEAYEKAVEIKNSGGDEAAANYLLGVILDQFTGMYEDSIRNASYKNTTKTMTAEKVDGKWLITDLGQ